MKLTKSQFALIILMTVILSFSTMAAQSGRIFNAMVGCEGIDRYYTGNGFYDDYNEYFNTVHSNINLSFTGDNQLANKVINVYAPKDMVKGNSFDCKSISNGIYCLAQKYDKVCKFTTSFKWSESLDDVMGHAGIKCWDDGFGDWVELY